MTVGNKNHAVNGKSFMEMFSLDFSKPLIAAVDCSGSEYETFRAAIQTFLVK